MKSTASSKTLFAAPMAVLLGATLGIALYTAPASCDEAEKPWGSEVNCGACHLTQAASLREDPQDKQPCLAAVHGGAEAKCVTCHQDAALEKVHANASAADAEAVKRLKKTKVPEDVCTSCHSKDALVEATATSDVLVDAEGTVFNPHAFPQIEKHKKLSCASCHDVHEPANTPMGDVANAACTKCHHEGVFRACNSCHDA